MLVQQSPRWVCRACLSIQTQSSHYRRLTHTSGQSSNTTENNVATAQQTDRALPTRRVPLKELLESKTKDKAVSIPEPLEQSFNNCEEVTEGQPPQMIDQSSSGSGHAESEKVGEPKLKNGPSRMRTARVGDQKVIRPKKLSFSFFSSRLKTKYLKQSAAFPWQSSLNPATQGSQETPTPEDTESSTSQASENVSSEPVQSVRSKKLETPATPLPPAPTTQLRHKHLPIKSTSDTNRAHKEPLLPTKPYHVIQTLHETKIHPADPSQAFPAFPGSAVREIVREHSEPNELVHRERLWSEDIQLTPIRPKEVRPVPTLEHGLDRVLFNPGVMYLRDPRSLVYNFNPYIEKIMPTEEFNYDALYEYITSSRDTTLVEMAKKCGANYVGSTSSMTAVLSHFHFLMSAWRPVNIDMLSTEYATQFRSFTAITRAPAGIFLRYKGDGVYAIDADKMYDTSETILSWLGRSMEKMLTLPPELMERFRKDNSHTLGPHERGQPEAYHYTRCGGMLMRSQLDCNDARLPGTGVFDLKTRACISVRMDVENSEEGAGYEIHHRTGIYNSFEREYYDMIRSAFLKYSLQVRIGNMDGVFVAYHNTKRIFGFQYISLDEMDAAIHGTVGGDIGRREFQFSVKLLSEALDRAARQFPKRSLRLTFEARETKTPQMYIFAEPYDEVEIDAIQTGEYIKTLRLAEERARAAKAKSASGNDSSSDDTILTTEPIESSSSETDNVDSEVPTAEAEETDELTDVQMSRFPVRDLLAMVVKTHNYINGVQHLGSPTPNAEDRWEITYSFETYPPERGLRLYQMCQDRRRKALDDEFRDQAVEESESARKAKQWSHGFLMHLKDLSSRGMKWRDEFERTAGARKKVVWKEGAPPSSFNEMIWKGKNLNRAKSEDED